MSNTTSSASNSSESPPSNESLRDGLRSVLSPKQFAAVEREEARSREVLSTVPWYAQRAKNDQEFWLRLAGSYKGD